MPIGKGLLRSLPSRLILGFIASTLITILAAGVPAYWFISTELRQEAWAHVDDGRRVTQALFEVEKQNLVNLTSLTAQRPTLERLLLAEDANSLDDYLKTFQSSIDLDILVVFTSSGHNLANGSTTPGGPSSPFTDGVTFHVIPGPIPSLALIYGSEVHQSDTGELLGYVTAGFLLDDEFMGRLADETGFIQSILIDERRISSSLSSKPSAIDLEAIELARSSREFVKASLTMEGSRYYTTLMPILDEQGELLAFSEVAHQVDDLIAAEHRALLTLNISTFLVAIIVSSLAALFARRITSPLIQLTEAAHKISAGDLSSPIPLPENPLEIASLAKALEESRINTHNYLETLSRAKAWSETLIQSIVEGIVTVDSQNYITSFSQGAERITGWLSSEAIHRHIDDVFRLAEDEGDFSDNLPPFGGMRQISVITRRGRPMTLAVTDARLRKPDTADEELALVLRDITEEEAAQHLRSYFLANISHEFRTPLSALNASVELLLDELEDLSPAEIGKLLNSIHMSVSGLQRLIDNLLESISIEAGRFQIRRRPTDLNKVILEAVRVMDPLLNRRQQNLSIKLPDQIPQVLADPTRLTQALVNLISNASKYSPIGKPINLNLDITSENQLLVGVADRGPGISPFERENLFRRFVRLGQNDKAQYGIGLGLSVVKAIIEEHGGVVGVDERLGGGSIFWFTLPLKEGET